MEKAVGCILKLLLTVTTAVFLTVPAQPAMAADGAQARMKALTRAGEKVIIQADRLEYDKKTGIYTATGNVRITQGDAVLTADRATLNKATGDAEARGRAELRTGGNVLHAKRIKVNFNTRLGVIEQGRMLVEKGNYHITGASMNRIKEDEYSVTAGSMTTCNSKLPFWKVTADSFDVRMGRDVRAKGVVLRIRDFPVFYTPYAWFPLIEPRTTGFLPPTAGYGSKDGFRFSDKFFWAPVDNFDATLHLDYRSRRGLGLGTEFRYALNENTKTTLTTYYLDDRLALKERYNIGLRHQQIFDDTISAKLDINLSDRQFYRDLTDTTKEITQRTSDSNLFVTDRWDWGRTYLFSQYTLGLVENNDFIVQRLPDLGLNVVKKRLSDLPVYLDLDTSGAYFRQQQGVDGGRFTAFPKLTGKLTFGGLTITPRLGYLETAYSLEGNGGKGFDDERGLLGTGVTAETGLNRLYSFASGPLTGIRHTLEPAVAYNYVMRRGGDRFPVWDDIDTFGRRNMVSYSLTNRFVLKYRDGAQTPRVDYVTIKLSQFCDLYKDTHVLGVARNFSTLYGETVYKSSVRFTINNDFRYNFYGGTFQSVNTDIRFDLKPDWLWAGLGQRFSRDSEQTFLSPSRFDFFTPSTDFVSAFAGQNVEERERVNFLTAEGGVKIGRHWEATSKVWYDVHTTRFRETDVSAKYTSQCWGVTASYAKRPRGTHVLVTLNLLGLGNILKI